MQMKKQPRLFLLLLAAVSGWVFLQCPCQAQSPSGFSCVLNPAEKNDSLAWWQTWRPVYETNVAFEAQLAGDTAALTSASYTFTTEGFQLSSDSPLLSAGRRGQACLRQSAQKPCPPTGGFPSNRS